MRQTNKQALEQLQIRCEREGIHLRKDKQGRFIFYKIVMARDRSPAIRASSIRYTNGAVVQVPAVNRNPIVDCGRGLHVLLGKPRWSTDRGDALIAVAVAPEDVACMPDAGIFAGRPKLRVRKLEVIKKRRWAS
jgi:hypothetical protein